MVDSWVGYTGGTTEAPTYGSVCKGDGHTEAVRLEFDPTATSYEAIIRHYFEDPYVRPSAGFEKEQYKTAIWAQDDAQRATALKVADEVGKDVPVYPRSRWWDAEGYHQHFNDPLAGRQAARPAARARVPQASWRGDE